MCKSWSVVSKPCSIRNVCVASCCPSLAAFNHVNVVLRRGVQQKKKEKDKKKNKKKRKRKAGDYVRVQEIYTVRPSPTEATHNCRTARGGERVAFSIWRGRSLTRSTVVTGFRSAVLHESRRSYHDALTAEVLNGGAPKSTGMLGSQDNRPLPVYKV